MLFWKRLRRSPNAATLTTDDSRPNSTQERRFFGILRSTKRKEVATPPPTYRPNGGDPTATDAPPGDGHGHPLGYEDAVTVELQAQENDYVLEESSRRVHCTPPPFYCPLPLTPPPSYTERQGTVAGARSGPPQLADNAATPARATASSSEAAARQQQARRRRRLRELQQQQQELRFASSTDSSSSSGSSISDCELGSGGSAVRRQRRRRRRRSRGLRDAYCPDLLHACALILQQPGSSDSSVGNFTATPPPPTPAVAHGRAEGEEEEEEGLEYSSDYVEIDELLPLVAAAVGPRAKSTPQLQHAVGLGLDDDAMGQNLSLRRPRISLTWVLREQQQPQPAAPEQTQNQDSNEVKSSDLGGDHKENELQHTSISIGNGGGQTRTEPVPTQLDVSVSKKRYRVKQLPGGTEPLNGYATTPTGHQAPGNGHLGQQKFFSNQNLLDYKERAVPRSQSHAQAGAPVAAASTKELLFVCTPQRAPKSDAHSEALILARKRNEIRKKLASRLQQARSMGVGAAASTNAGESCNGQARASTVTTADSLKCTYSEPSLVAASEVGCGVPGGAAPQQQRRHRHRKRRDRNRVQRFGYEIHNVDEFLSRCSLATPGNIPVVLATASTLYQTRPGGYQLEIPLPLGMVVNAVFKNQNWLYVQTPHAEEGYVGYACCLPLGILPQAARSGSRHTPCWESNADVFPRPCGNMTDSEKEIRMRGGTRSDGARTPRSSKPVAEVLPLSINNNNNNNNSISQHQVTKGGSTTSSLYGEQHVDKLYLRAASQPKLVEKAYAQLRSTKQVGLASGSASVRSGASNDEYVTLQQQQQQQQKSTKKQPHLHVSQSQSQSLATRRVSNVSYITNGHNGQHLHPKTLPQQPQQPHHQPAVATALSVLRKQQHNGLRQTLVAINSDYVTESIAVHKGDIVTLCECRESKDQRQWFYVKTRDGREGFIPAEVAGHGYL
ncbi:uncharacterized protein LOC111070916 [Drosophila obscura]|uniref:uncharacterized protein LOC111070916 n=1 Tax=Drosophila obscura TaxID=7282 RepID=UPI001BB1D8A5|nr:uncharacterized protein LOC111070916 [Drosophila obscura]